MERSAILGYRGPRTRVPKGRENPVAFSHNAPSRVPPSLRAASSRLDRRKSFVVTPPHKHKPWDDFTLTTSPIRLSTLDLVPDSFPTGVAFSGACAGESRKDKVNDDR